MVQLFSEKSAGEWLAFFLWEPVTKYAMLAARLSLEAKRGGRRDVTRVHYCVYGEGKGRAEMTSEGKGTCAIDRHADSMETQIRSQPISSPFGQTLSFPTKTIVYVV